MLDVFWGLVWNYLQAESYRKGFILSKSKTLVQSPKCIDDNNGTIVL